MVYCRPVTRKGPTAPNFLVRWSIEAVIAGGLGASLVQLFSVLLDSLTGAVQNLPVHPLPVAALAAALTGLLFYRIAPGAAGEGIPAYLDSVRSTERPLPLLDTVIKFPVALLTLGCYGSGGAVGPVGRVSAGLSQWATRRLQTVFPRLLGDHEQHHAQYHAPTTAAISGMAAAVAAIFGAPIAAAVFAVEVIQTDQLRYHQLFPAALSSSAAVILMSVFGWAHPVALSLPPFELHAPAFLAVIAVGMMSGWIGVGYVALYAAVSRRLGRRRARVRVAALVAGMALSALLVVAIDPVLAGTSRELFEAVTSGTVVSRDITVLGIHTPVILGLAVLIIAKVLGNCLTTGSGMSAGFTGPAALVGLLGGAFIALILGYEASSPGYSTLVVAGFSGMLAAAMNTPLAAAILAAELFGGGYGVAGALAAMIAFQIARFRTIYEVALASRHQSS